jgi:hypothetical protein
MPSPTRRNPIMGGSFRYTAMIAPILPVISTMHMEIGTLRYTGFEKIGVERWL